MDRLAAPRLRAPRLRRAAPQGDAGRHALRAAALVALALLLPLGAAAQSRTAGRVDGLVYDSVAGRPLAGAVVQLVTPDHGDSRAVITDAEGGFRVDRLAPGVWVVGAVHPRLDSLGIVQLSQGLVVAERGTTRVTLGVPSAQALITRTCGAAATADSGGYVHGTLRDVRGRARAGSVRLVWQEVLLERNGQTDFAGTGIEAVVDTAGRFVACGVPANTLVFARGSQGADSTGVVQLLTPATGIGLLDLVVGANRVQTVTAPAARGGAGEPSTTTVLRGSGRLEGTTRTSTGQPLREALVTVWSTGLETRSGPDGRFTLEDLPLGSFTLEARAVGYEPLRRTVTLLPDSAPPVALLFERLVVLDPLEVRAAALGPDLAAFEERRRLNATRARFFGPEEIEQLNLLRLSDLFVRIPGLRVTSQGVVMRGASLSRWCTPAVFIDGMRMTAAANLENLVNVLFVRAVEVYPTPAAVPPQFGAGLTGCGAIVIWTGDRL